MLISDALSCAREDEKVLIKVQASEQRKANANLQTKKKKKKTDEKKCIDFPFFQQALACQKYDRNLIIIESIKQQPNCAKTDIGQ